MRSGALGCNRATPAGRTSVEEPPAHFYLCGADVVPEAVGAQDEELVAVAPYVLAKAKRLRRDHPREAEICPVFDPGRDVV